jgi:arginyl-tRNA synthetase
MEQYLQRIFRQALDDIGASDVAVIKFEVPQNARHGDLSTNVAMTLAKQLKRPPREVAQQIVGALRPDNGYVRSIDIAGPGFINVTFSPDCLVDQLRDMLARGPSFGRTTHNQGKTVNIEWVSANPTGNLHAGHGRQVCLGQAISNLLEWTGCIVTREFYYNNAGNQMVNLAKSLRTRYRQNIGTPLEAELKELEENGYRGVEILEIAKQIFLEFGDSKWDAPLSFFQSYGEQANFASQRRALDRLGVHHDIFFNENSLYDSGAVAETIQAFKDKGLAYEKDGAVWLKLSEMGEKDDRVIVKSTGEPTYRLPDIAYHRNKLSRGYDELIDIFGADHIATIPDVLAGLRGLGYDTARIKVVIHQMVSFVAGDEVIKFSKRSGGTYTLEELLDDVGTDAAKFFFNMRSVGSHLEFDVELAKEQSEKNPVYYVQYAHARIASILRFAGQQGLPISFDADADVSALAHPEELALIKVLLRLPEIIERSAASLAPHHLCEYLREVAAQFHKFYHECRIVGSGEPLQSARLALAFATKRVLAAGCAVLSIGAPESM